MIEARNISKSFGEKTLFENLDIKINEKDRLAIVGKSGSGKSTLLNILSLIEKPDSGHIYWKNKKIKDIEGADINRIIRYEIAYLFQNYALIDNKTAYENVKIATKYLKISKEEKEDLINRALIEVGLIGIKNRKVYTLSGGEQQRVALARIIVKPCDIIFADEPTGNLDKENSNKIFDILFKLNEKGKTLVVVTHDRSFLNNFDKVIDLNI